MKRQFSKILLAFLLLCGTLFASISLSLPTYAVPEGPTVNGNDLESAETQEKKDQADEERGDQDNKDQKDEDQKDDKDKDDENEDEEEEEEKENICENESKSLSWIICASGRVAAGAVDSIYEEIEKLLIVQPLTTNSESPIYLVWKYARDITNIVFIIMFVIVICSQLSGIGIDNYGIKRILPRLIIAAILVNLSYFICSLAVDVSNVAGASLRNVFLKIEEAVSANADSEISADISWGNLIGALTGGATIAGLVIEATGGASALFWIIIVTLFAAVIAILTGLVTIAARQGLVSILVMISPLAFVAYLLPNTEQWFKKWRELFSRMIVFYPMFSVLFGASQLVGWTLMVSGLGSIWTVMGLAIQVLPLFLSVKLMQMSGTVLGSFNAALRRAASPLQRGVDNWSQSHAERQRERYLAHSSSSGAHLRRFLDYRRTLRELDTENSKKARADIASTRAYRRLASSTGRDTDGNDTWSKRPNRYTRNAKASSLYSIRAQAAKTAFDNTITAYNFDDKRAKQLAAATGNAYLDLSTQRFREKNEAQSDQTWLLDQYLNASTNQYTNPHNYNRLIKNGAGSLQHLGESSIMGQVIADSVAIEERRRREARVIANKFGVDKPSFRAMVFNKKDINDDGYERNEKGEVIEDQFFRLKAGHENEHREWDKYIARERKTGKEISQKRYDALSEIDKQKYDKIRYMDIEDDKGNPVNKVYFDDAGYMKELLTDDTAIGDPINHRYNISLGVAHTPNEETGALRKYYSTIVSGIDNSGFKVHSAKVNAMLLSQIRNGYITSIGQYYIGSLQSTKNAAKPGDFLINDATDIDTWGMIFKSIQDDELFSQIFTDNDINDYRNVNGQELGGLFWDADQNKWKSVEGRSATLEEKKNYLKHNLIPKTAQKIFGMVNRNVSPNVADKQKPETVTSLLNLIDVLAEVYDNNKNPDVPIEKKFNPDIDIFGANDPQAVKAKINTALESRGLYTNPHQQKRQSRNNNDDGRQSFIDKLNQLKQKEDRIRDTLASYFEIELTYENIANGVIETITNDADLSEIYDEVVSAVQDCSPDETAAFKSGISREEFDRESIDKLKKRIDDILNQFFARG